MTDGLVHLFANRWAPLVVGRNVGLMAMELFTPARDALAQVRSAVSGIRSAAIAAELASAKLLLEADGVMLTSEMDALSMPAEVESTLAMTLREAATKIHRHAGARHARV